MTDKPYTTNVRRTPWPEGQARALGTPLQPSVVYAAESPDALDDQYEGRAEGFTYSREGHPNAVVLAQMIDRMERAPAPGGWITGSGMAALSALFMSLLKTGDHVVGGDQLYGRSLRMMNEELPRFGVATTLADPTDVAQIEAALRPETKMILIEVVSNPTLRVADTEAIIALAKSRGIISVVDNTFTTPRGVRPFDLGADIVVHSVTKLLAGHSDAMLGYIAARDPVHQAAIQGTAITMGLTPSPFDCWLAERGLYSFDLRYDRACENAARLADHLAGLAGVRKVLYPTRPDHPDHNRAVGLLSGQGGNMVSFEIAGGRDQTNALVRAIPDMAFAPTLGDIGTTLSHPATSSHRALSVEARAAVGITEGFFRVSVGVEPFELLAQEFEQAVTAAR